MTAEVTYPSVVVKAAAEKLPVADATDRVPLAQVMLAVPLVEKAVTLVLKGVTEASRTT
jgi:hypothetical protein